MILFKPEIHLLNYHVPKLEIFIMTLVILYFHVKGKAQYVNGPKGKNPSCAMGSIMVRNGIECKEACNQLNVPINDKGIMISGRPCYITNIGECRQKEENTGGHIGNGELICRKSGYGNIHLLQVI